MEHLFIEIMVKEKQETALKGLATPARHTSPVKHRQPRTSTRLMDSLGNALIRLGRYIKTRHGQPVPCPVAAQTCHHLQHTCHNRRA